MRSNSDLELEPLNTTALPKTTCGLHVLAKPLSFSRRQTEIHRPFLGMNIHRGKSFSNRSDICSIRADGFIALVKQQFKGFSEVHKGKGDLWSVKSNDWE